MVMVMVMVSIMMMDVCLHHRVCDVTGPEIERFQVLQDLDILDKGCELGGGDGAAFRK